MDLTIAICANDKVICEQIAQIILDHTTEKSLTVCIDVFYDGQSLVEHIENKHNNYDLIYLDMKMDELDGIAVGKRIRTKLKDHKVQLVYISETNQNIRQLFEVQPLLFILKPIEPSKIDNSIELSIEKLGLSPKIFHYKKRKEYFNVLLEDIIYFESSGRSIKIKTVEGQDNFVGRLKSIIKELKGQGFIQVSQSIVVNCHFVSKYSREEITLINKEVVGIPKSKRTEVKKQFLREMDKR